MADPDAAPQTPPPEVVAAEKGESAMQLLQDADPALFLSPSTDLAAAARTASQHIYSSLAPLSPAQPPPLPTLLADAAFDAEQIWSQIELLARPILPHLRRQLRHLEQQPPSQPQAALPMETPADAEEEQPEDGQDSEMDGLKELEEIDDDDDLGDDDDLDDSEEEEEEEDRRGGNLKGLEDQFLKIDEMADFLDKGDEEEYGGGANQVEKATKNRMEESDDEGEDRYEGEDDDEGQLDLEDFEDDDEEGEGEDGGGIMYKDFFMKGHNQQVKQRVGSTKKVQFKDEAYEIELGGSEIDDGNEEQGLSTHEKERLKMRAEIEQMEKANLEPGTWTMHGEVTASSRPKNSALEVDLDFEHNVRPAPVITEEITASLEEMIKKRIAEGHFDDVEKPSLIPSKAPKEHKELDESKSKKGLAELYEDDYAQKAGIASAPLSISDELKKEANTLFKRICLKLDALSHFHFAPKPVIEDMSVQANVPALAMEEIAPVAVSDAAMLAPEEIFEGKGDIKEEGELTQAERKRRRANKKRRYAGLHKERPAKLQKD
ncbi:U3 small nucleolar ribonucleoprotein MPP10-like [Panicum miliaceum]|uniref:U3 small nucleolar ribonucleoprotein protein MPP10 n=1 Tax=Panicum miliaceum TaxID=4540 RepID=A0A3L6RG22_PANMI|nr:U3 small nucleolar ribonucleoprotein MPP10-like [Panicum miliaceum]